MKITDRLILWTVGLIFAAGIMYANVMKLPAIEKRTGDLEIRQSVTETHYIHIKESLDRIETKIDNLEE